MRFTSGVTDQYIYFVAVDSTDYVTRKTGLTTFTVYRARNGAAAAAYTTPTVAEVSSANMPGVYSLLLDEDMTIGSGNDSEEVVLHITQASMAPVTVKFELYRNVVTAGETLTVSSGSANAAVQSVANNAITAAAVADGAIDAATFAAGAIDAAAMAADAGTEIGTAVWASATRTITALDEDSVTLDLDATIRAAIGLATANLDTQIGLLATAANLATVAGYLDTEIAAILADTNELQTDWTNGGRLDLLIDSIVAAAAPTANANADALLDRAAGVETGLTVRQAMRLMAAVLYGKASGMTSTTAVFRDIGDTKDRITATVDSDGNRTAISRDAT